MSAVTTAQPSGHLSTFWIDFDEARNAVETIVEVAHDDPEERPTCIVLTGQSGMGKTSILREAQRRLTEALPEPADWGEARYQPVLRTVIPSSPTSLKINLALLWKQGWPIRTNTHKTADFKVVDHSHSGKSFSWLNKNPSRYSLWGTTFTRFAILGSIFFFARIASRTCLYAFTMAPT